MKNNMRNNISKSNKSNTQRRPFISRACVRAGVLSVALASAVLTSGCGMLTTRHSYTDNIQTIPTIKNPPGVRTSGVQSRFVVPDPQDASAKTPNLAPPGTGLTDPDFTPATVKTTKTYKPKKKTSGKKETGKTATKTKKVEPKKVEPVKVEKVEPEKKVSQDHATSKKIISGVEANNISNSSQAQHRAN